MRKRRRVASLLDELEQEEGDALPEDAVAKVQAACVMKLMGGRR